VVKEDKSFDNAREGLARLDRGSVVGQVIVDAGRIWGER
jgi:hypothetical protein